MSSLLVAQSVRSGDFGVTMASARSIVSKLVARGVIPVEFEEDAVVELHRELSRRARRTVQTLAALTSNTQLAVRYADSLIKG